MVMLAGLAGGHARVPLQDLFVMKIHGTSVYREAEQVRQILGLFLVGWGAGRRVVALFPADVQSRF